VRVLRRADQRITQVEDALLPEIAWPRGGGSVPGGGDLVALGPVVGVAGIERPERGAVRRECAVERLGRAGEVALGVQSFAPARIERAAREALPYQREQ
jgi:hypothetical protein